MAKMVLTTQYVALNSTDLSTYCNKAELQVEVESKEVTTFGSSGNKEFIGGLKSGTLSLEFKQDFANAALDSILWPLLGTVVTFEVRPTSSAASTSNPKYTGSVLITGHNPITGGVGDEATISISFPTTGAISRATA